MIVWILIIFVLASFSLFSRIFPDTFPPKAQGVVDFGIDLALFLVALGILARMNFFERKREKENLRKKIEELEKKCQQE